MDGELASARLRVAMPFAAVPHGNRVRDRRGLHLHVADVRGELRTKAADVIADAWRGLIVLMRSR